MWETINEDLNFSDLELKSQEKVNENRDPPPSRPRAPHAQLYMASTEVTMRD